MYDSIYIYATESLIRLSLLIFVKKMIPKLFCYLCNNQVFQIYLETIKIKN